MIPWTKLLFNEKSSTDYLRYAKNEISLHKNCAKPVVVWNITPACNLGCFHCYFDAKKSYLSNALPEDSAKNIILNLGDFKIQALIFSGGEPLLRKDIFNLALYAKKRCIRTAISTNGTLITPSVAKKIKHSGIKYVGISIDGRPSTHDRMRGEKGSFNKAVLGMRNCRAEGLKTGLRFTLTKTNYKDLDFIFDLAKREKLNRLCIYHLVYSGRAGRDLDISFDKKTEVLELIFRQVKDFNKQNLGIEILTVDNHADGIWICSRLKKTDPAQAAYASRLLAVSGGNSAGISLCCVDHLGNVYPDQFSKNRILGNVLNNKFLQIWHNKRDDFLYRLRHRHRFVKGRCAGCVYFALCNGNMRQRAYAVFGDFWQEDPACYLNNREINNESALDILGDYKSLQPAMPTLQGQCD